jgi:CO dehydrogenase nickel-insertion accessory protein CooC1
MEQMNIEITGPQGCGKNLTAAMLAIILQRFGAKPMVFDDEMPIGVKLDSAIISEMKRVFSGREVFIQISNSKKDSSPLSVDAALELILTHDVSAPAVRRGYVSAPADENDCLA